MPPNLLAHYLYLWELTAIQQAIETAWISASVRRTFIELLVPAGSSSSLGAGEWGARDGRPDRNGHRAGSPNRKPAGTGTFRWSWQARRSQSAGSHRGIQWLTTDLAKPVRPRDRISRGAPFAPAADGDRPPSGDLKVEPWFRFAALVADALRADEALRGHVARASTKASVSSLHARS